MSDLKLSLTEALPVAKPSSKRGTQLQLPSGDFDIDAIAKVVSDWLVPLLVKDFLAEVNAINKTSEVEFEERPQKRSRRKA